MKFTNEENDALNKEIEALKKHAYKDELKNLNLETFDPTLSHGCIYGQLTGECHSVRAKHLLNLCGVPYSSKIDSYVETTSNHFNDRKLFVVGHDDNYSILEYFIFNYPDSRENIIKLLKS